VLEIVIHRCALRIVRKGGWSWGPDPKRSAQDLAQDFIALLARQLAVLLGDDDDREFAAPVHLRIPVRPADLVALFAARANAGAADERRPATMFEQRLDQSLRTAFGLEPQREPERKNRFERLELGGRPDAVPPTPGAAGILAKTLLMWATEGVLARRLAACSGEQIRAWHDALLANVEAPDDRAGVPASDDDGARLIVFIRDRARTVVPPAERIRQRILVATEAAARFGVAPTHRLLRHILDRELPVAFTSTPYRTIGPTHGAALTMRAPSVPIASSVAGPLQEPVGMQHDAPRRASLRAPSSWSVKIDCALPFLLLGPLARFGYFDTLSAVLEGSRTTGDAPHFAAALAYKVLDPPRRGWRRTPESALAAATFAGSQDMIDESALVDLSRRLAPHMGPLDLLLSDAVTSGRVPGEPVVLRRLHPESDTAALLLLDTPGCFPLAHANDIELLLPLLARLDNPVLIVSRDTASPRLLSALDAAGRTFVTDAPPTRHETWQRVQRGAIRFGWTNASTLESKAILRAARQFAAACEDADELWQQLVAARPGIVRAYNPALDRHLTLAAAFAMGLSAWKLWQGSGPVSPQMALHQFSDLDAWVRFDTTSVRVSLPLGRRLQALDKAGLLAPVAAVPWLGGRRVEFGGG
jgi:hypothetical protein